MANLQRCGSPFESMMRPLLTLRDTRIEDVQSLQINLTMVANQRVLVLASTLKADKIETLSQHFSLVSLPVEEWRAATILYHEQQSRLSLTRTQLSEAAKVFRFNACSWELHPMALLISRCCKVILALNMFEHS